MKITKSEQQNELLAALAKAQAKIQPASKDKANPFFKSKYADLASVWDSCRGPLSENGLSIMQLPTTTPEGLFLTTILGHASGQWISSEVMIPLAKNDPQTTGSAITYFRRYCLSALVGVAPEDDDGEKATQPYRHQNAINGDVPKTKITKDQETELKAILDDCDEGYRKWFFNNLKTQYKTLNLSDIPSEAYAATKASAFKQMEANHARQQQLAAMDVK